MNGDNGDPSLCAALKQFWWRWRVLPAAINTFVKSFRCANHHPIRIGDEPERLVTGSPVTESRGPSWGKQLPGEQPRETAET